jgi:hypothetical protein
MKATVDIVVCILRKVAGSIPDEILTSCYKICGMTDVAISSCLPLSAISLAIYTAVTFG